MSYNFISVCLPDGTVQVTNPNVGVYSHVFAVQDEGVSAAVKCTVSTSGAQSNITGCSQVGFQYLGLSYYSDLFTCYAHVFLYSFPILDKEGIVSSFKIRFINRNEIIKLVIFFSTYFFIWVKSIYTIISGNSPGFYFRETSQKCEVS